MALKTSSRFIGYPVLEIVPVGEEVHSAEGWEGIRMMKLRALICTVESFRLSYPCCPLRRVDKGCGESIRIGPAMILMLRIMGLFCLAHG